MPTITSNSKSLVLVTGVTGYIAAWVARVLLERGHDVRGTVRSAKKGQELLEEFKKKIPGYGVAGKLGRFEFVIVEDIAKPGAFDEAVKGVDAVEHIASPFHLKADDPQELIIPAVNGTVGILESIKKDSDSKVKRVVITASCACIFRAADHPLTLSEEDWNSQSIQDVEEKGRNATNVAKYRVSKTLAEKAAYEWVASHQPLSWDIVTLNPPFVFGPATNVVPSPSNLGTSATDWYQIATTSEPDAAGKTHEQLAANTSSWVDVRDLGEAHVRALEKEEAGGNRIIITSGHFTWQDWLDAANALKESPYAKPLAKGNPGAGKMSTPQLVYKADKAKRILGLSRDGEADWTLKSVSETARDTLADYAARGW